MSGPIASCPRCGSAMVGRTNRDTGEQFYGCTRFPACRGTRPHSPASRPTRPSGPTGGAASPRRRQRVRLSLGGRPRGLADDAELLVARLVGHTLSPMQGCIVQIAAMGLFVLAAWAFFASGAAAAIAEALGRFVAQNMHFGPRPTP